MLLNRLYDKRLISPPEWLPDNTVYLTTMGSYAYGCQNPDSSDHDVYGVVIPPKHLLFPQLNGHIFYSDNNGNYWVFGGECKSFGTDQCHHVQDVEARKQYDFQFYNIVNYFQLLMENNPNIIDSLFTAADCVLHGTHVANMMRENRQVFLHKGLFDKFKGYALSQLHKMTTKDPQGKRKEVREKYGFDLKFAYHVVRLLSEAEQLLVEGDLDLRRNREQLKTIRRGEMSEQEIREWAAQKERHLDDLRHKSQLPEKPQKAKIKQLLFDCLEHHYGNLKGAVEQPDEALVALREVWDVMEKYRELVIGRRNDAEIANTSSGNLLVREERGEGASPQAEG